MNSPSPRWKAVAVLCLVFALGLFVGIGGGALAVRRALQKQVAAGNVGTPLIDHLERGMSSKLHLTPAERTAVGKELEITRRELREHRQQLLEQLQATSEDTLSRLKAHLPPEKQAELEELARKRLGPWGLLIKK